MLTLETSAHVPASRHHGNFRFSPASTGAPLARVAASRLHAEWIRLLDAESRRLWLEILWRSHLQRVRSTRVRKRP